MRRRAPELRSSPRKRGPRATDRGVWIPAYAGMNGIGRREFISLLGGAAAPSIFWPLAARAQQPAMPVIGYLSARSREDTSHLITAFQRGLAESDYIDGRNVTIEYRFALGQYDKLPAMANELVRLPVTVVATTGGEPSALA